MKKYKLLLYYTMIFGVVGFSLLFILQDRSLIQQRDNLTQVYPSYYYVGRYIRQVIKDLLHGDFHLKQYDFSIGYGAGIIPTLNYYGFGDPFMLIMGILLSHPAYAYRCVLLGKLYVAGICFLIYCKKKGHTDPAILLSGTFVYLLNGWLYRHVFWGFSPFLSNLVYFPIICAGIDEYVDNQKKRSYWLILGVFLQACNGFYGLYMTAIMAGIYGGVRILVLKDLKKSVSIVGKIVRDALLGIGMSGVLFIPAIIAYLSSSRFGETPIKVAWFFKPQVYAEMFMGITQTLSLNESFSYIGLPITALLVLGCFVWKEKEKNEYKVLLGILILLTIFTGVTSWVAGGFPNRLWNYNRWGYALEFMLAYGIVLSEKYMSKWTAKRETVTFWFVVIWTVVVLILSRIYETDIQGMWERRFTGNAIFLGISILFIFVMRHCKTQEMRKGMLLLTIIVYAVVNMYTVFGNGSLSEKKDGMISKEYAKAVVQNGIVNEALINQDLSGVQRMDVYNYDGCNASLFVPYYGTSSYYSLTDDSMIKWSEKYNIGNYWKLNGLDNRKNLISLLSCTYYLDNSGNLLKNDNALPFGILFDSYAEEEKVRDSSVIERYATCLDLLILKESPEKESSCVEKEDLSSGIMVLIDDYRMEEQDGQRNIQFTAPVAGECIVATDDEMYVISDVDPGENLLGVNAKALQLFESNGKLYIIDRSKMEKALTERRNVTFENVITEKNRVNGTINTSKAGLLFLSVPYNVGWTAKIDGVETKIYQADYGFMALDLEEGMHEIELRYETPGLKIGILLSIISMWIVMTLNQVDRKSRKEK